MRTILQKIQGVPDHLGLAYQTWARTLDFGKVPDQERGRWLEQVSNVQISDDYKQAYARWKKSFRHPQHRTFELQLLSRLLVGQGCNSATDVGLTIQHTWGVPMIPGSAIKGLLAHYLEICYGPENPDLPPWVQPEKDRLPWQGVTRQDGQIKRGPGKLYRRLFGAPEALEDELMSQNGFDAGAIRGEVVFHDAIFVPSGNMKPFAADVITVHQKSYYDKRGQTYPNDFDSPNPVGFITVRPQISLLFALSGPKELTELAESLLRDALKEWGIGAKTSSGYGRFMKAGSSNKEGSSSHSYLNSNPRSKSHPEDTQMKAAFSRTAAEKPQSPNVDLSPGKKIVVIVDSEEGSRRTATYLGVRIQFTVTTYQRAEKGRKVEVRLKSKQQDFWNADFVSTKG